MFDKLLILDGFFENNLINYTYICTYVFINLKSYYWSKDFYHISISFLFTR